MNWKKINLYILISFAISWSVALAMKLANIQYGGVASNLILGFLYMPGPALATFIIQKYIFKENFKSYGWTFDRTRIKWVLLTPVVFLALFTLAFAIVGLLGNTHIVSQFGEINFSRESLNHNLLEIVKRFGIDISDQKITDMPIPPRLLFVATLGQGIIAGATLSLPFMFGEEFGWRGLLLRETQKLGFSKANLFIGVTWGLWHLPIILMGHNYPNHPYLGVLMMCLFTTSITPLFAYVRLKTKSILGPCMLHGMINATATLFALYIANANELYSSLAGWAGIIAGFILTAGIYFLDKAFVVNYASAE